MNLRVMVLGVVLFLAGCRSASQPAEPVVVQFDPAALGTISGTVSFTGVAPTPLKIDTSMDPACNLSDGAAPLAEQIVVKGGKLANVFLYLKSGPAAAMNAPATSKTPIVLNQKNCIYTPHVIALQQGNAVEFHNDDPTMHNIHTMAADNPNLDISQGPRGAPQTKFFAKSEAMIAVRCNNHPWMNAFINVSATRFYAVSDGDGHFTISGLPAGEYTLAAIHERLGEQTTQLRVAPQTVAKVDFAFASR